MRVKNIAFIGIFMLLILFFVLEEAFSQGIEEAEGLNQQATELYQQGRYQEAIPLAEKALAIDEKARGPDHPDVATDLNNLALLYHVLGDYTRAEPRYKRALEISEKARGKDHPEVATSLNNLAGLYLEDERLDEAFRILQKQDNPMGLGKYYLAKKDYRQAEKEFLRSLKGGTVEPYFLIADYTGLGLSYEGQGNHTKAKEYFKKAIDIIEGQWNTLSAEAKKDFLSAKAGAGFSRLEPYEGLIRVILKERGKGFQKDALIIAERVKGRTFLEMLATRELKGKGKEDEEMIKRDRHFQRELLSLRKQLEVQEGLKDRGSKAKIAELREAISKKEREYVTFIEEVKFKNSELGSLISVSPVPIEEIQSRLDKDITLLEYYTARDRTYAWLLTRETLQVYELALTEQMIKKEVKELRFPNISDKARKPLPTMVYVPKEAHEKETLEKEREENRRRFLSRGQRLYQELFSPLEPGIKTKRLVIVLHGVLHKVPFAALGNGKDYLIDRYDLSFLPSASTITYLKKKGANKEKRFLGFANPVTDYLPLGFAEREVENISSLFKVKEAYKGKEATETLFKGKAQGFEVIHLAIHGEFNEIQPLFSGLLFTKDEENDGYFQVHESFGLDLRKAILATLSACETGLGKIEGGDDLVGLSRGFIYAEASSILATLWEVDDKSTSILMEHFYHNWQGGMSKPEALKQAQETLKQMPQYKHPYYWSGFVIIGDWK